MLQNSLNRYHIAMESPERLDKDSDEALLERSRSDPEAFRDFYERHARRIYEWFKHRTPSTEVAHDLTAETFAQALSSLRRFRGSQPGAAGAWLQAIAMNMLRIYYRQTRVESRMRRRLGMTIPTNAPVDTDRVDDLAEVEAFAPLLASALRLLSKPRSRRAGWSRETRPSRASNKPARRIYPTVRLRPGNRRLRLLAIG